MATNDHSPRAFIGAALARAPDAIVDASIGILERLANTLIGIIGEPSFETLLFRTVQRVNMDFPWLIYDPRIPPADPEFNALRRCLEGEDRSQVTTASTLLFNTFIDILAPLIGAHLTMLILHAALDPAGVDKISKE